MGIETIPDPKTPPALTNQESSPFVPTNEIMRNLLTPTNRNTDNVLNRINSSNRSMRFKSTSENLPQFDNIPDFIINESSPKLSIYEVPIPGKDKDKLSITNKRLQEVITCHGDGFKKPFCNSKSLDNIKYTSDESLDIKRTSSSNDSLHTIGSFDSSDYQSAESLEILANDRPATPTANDTPGTPILTNKNARTRSAGKVVKPLVNFFSNLKSPTAARLVLNPKSSSSFLSFHLFGMA